MWISCQFCWVGRSVLGVIWGNFTSKIHTSATIFRQFIQLYPTGMVGNASKIHKFTNPTIFSTISEPQYVVYAMLYTTRYSNYLNCAYNTIQFIKLWPIWTQFSIKTYHNTLLLQYVLMWCIWVSCISYIFATYMR